MRASAITLALVAGLLAGCGDGNDGNDDPARSEVPSTTLGYSVVESGNPSSVSCEETVGHHVITDEAAAEVLTATECFEVPTDVDFGEQVLIAVSATAPDLAYELEAHELRVDGSDLRLETELRRPAGVDAGQAINYPFVVVAVDRAAAVQAGFDEDATG